MICENCSSSHSGSYGSGRFCDAKCARGFSTKSSRSEINRKVSSSLKGRSLSRPGFKHSEETKILLRQKKLQLTIEQARNKPFDALSKSARKTVVLEEQNRKCLECGLGEIWNGKKLTLQIDHIDGNNQNNVRENLRGLCPNCHTQTPTYGSKNMSEEAKEKMKGIAAHMRTFCSKNK